QQLSRGSQGQRRLRFPSFISKLSKNRGKTSQDRNQNQTQNRPNTEPLDPANQDQFSGIKVTKPCRQQQYRRR
ncbi:hypothetical protein, partial [Roseibium sp. MMSF_3544]|uniref:hypothetical protein n=1 Tax=Roseibium sp. MMSF_3544 TaxID=3046723 RepID=UPI00273F3E33